MYESNVNVTETNYAPQTRTASVLLCESQPLTVEGVRAVLESTSDLRVTGGCENLALCREISRRQRPDVVLIDKALGVQAVMDWIQDLRLADQDLERLMLATGRPGDMG
ncbi:MAG: hypothetical protein ACK5TN_20760, partial [Acidobacteriota bacterium]